MNYVELLQSRSQTKGSDNLYTFLKDGEEESDTLTYAELDECAKKIGARLQRELDKGSRAILLFPAGLDFIRTYFACLYSGIIPIPLPMPTSKESSLKFINSIIDNAEVSAIITSLSAIKNADFLNQINSTKILNLDKINISKELIWNAVDIKETDIAFLQYTSGSTGSPKGVMVTHKNLIHNQILIQEAYQTKEKTVFVSWLPHYHDMGLIGSILHPIYSGCRMVLMSPMAFSQKPIRWLNAISKYKGTISGAPNFAYEHCVNRITEEQKKSLDLSSWLVAFNGAEKVRLEAIERFSSTFASCGFSRQSFFPTYGLAESTLFVTGGGYLSGPSYLSVDKNELEKNKVVLCSNAYAEESQLLVSVGRPWLDQEVLIVNSDTHQQCSNSETGEIWLKGASVTKGYWNNPEKTKEQFQAYLNNGEGPYYKTGDLGFIYNNNLYITGRVKDLIIIRGRNIYPDDIENCAQLTHPALRVSSGAAFSVDINGLEQLVLVQEVERTALHHLKPEKIFKDIKTQIFKHFDLNIHTIVLIMPHKLPKTTSGKVKRQQTKTMFLNNTLSEVARNSLNENRNYKPSVENECVSYVS